MFQLFSSGDKVCSHILNSLNLGGPGMHHYSSLIFVMNAWINICKCEFDGRPFSFLEKADLVK